MNESKITEFLSINIDYSKELTITKSGRIVSKRDQNYLIVNFPKLGKKENKIIENIKEELKFLKKEIRMKKDIYFLLKSYCIENAILLNKEEREAILTILEWEILNESILTPFLEDENLEEIAVNGINVPIMVYHNIFGWVETNLYFTTNNKIKTLVNRIAAPLGRQLSFNTPVINATLKNGSRLNASIDPIAFSGANLTIRKFKENPMNPINIIDSKTANSELFGFFWLLMQTSSSILISGNTGSGKTTTLNSLFCFLPKSERIVVVEETPEITLPQKHKIKLNTHDKVGIGLDNLIDNTFRMRPDRVIVGEVRTKNEASAFVNTMLAGQAKGSYATFHAESSKEAIERLISFGIEKNAIMSIDIIIVQKRISKINKKTKSRNETRKIVEVCEIINNDGEIETNMLFKYDFEKDTWIKINDSIRIKEEIKKVYSVNEKEYKKLLNEKIKILNNLTNDINFEEFFEIVENEN
jgi:flagellar protein FlaI